MVTLIASFLAILTSSCALLFLVRSNPKRHRHSHNIWPTPAKIQQAIALMILAPGLILLLLGCYSGVLIWFGAMTLLGWVSAIIPSRII